uniref:Uncharacterized protein n=1 Tax=Rhizophora mucronata TaxID=61149 RepID=A0A2P2QWY5_RHIMU
MHIGCFWGQLLSLMGRIRHSSRYMRLHIFNSNGTCGSFFAAAAAAAAV